MNPTNSTYTRVAAAALGLLIASSTTTHAQCADFDEDGTVTAVDALAILQVGVGINECAVARCDVDGSGNVNATDALFTLMSAVGRTVALSCPPVETLCLNDLDFFFQEVWTPILTDCIACHNADGIANYTDHVLVPSSEAGYLEHNYQVLSDLASITGSKNGADLLLSKPQGISHGGGQRLDITPSSRLYDNLVELLDRFENPVNDCEAGGDYWDGIQLESDAETLEKSVLIFAGRRPSFNEYSRASADEAGLRRAIRESMTGDAFDDFIRESVNDHLLTDKYLIRQSNAFGVLQGEYQYEHLYSRIEAVEAVLGEDAGRDAWTRTNQALAREPLELFAHIARNDRPYTEVVTANYMMVNPWSSKVYRSAVNFDDEFNDDDWKQGTNRGYRLGSYPHAGVLTSPMILARFPSTSTNRNRARARWTAKFFLGVDIEALAPRTVNPADLDDNDNPTMTNPNCTVCHSVMDPIAGLYQNFGDDGIFLESDSDSLPRSYKRTDLYENGDRWFRDMREPGFGQTRLPESATDRSLPWLGAQIAADPRFARGAVEFWYQSMFGRTPLARPTDPSQPDYAPRLAAFTEQDVLFEQVATKFRDGTAGTGRRGPYRLKDLLVELVMTPLFRANAADDAFGSREIALDNLGFFKLLTPEQLNRRFEALTGYRWARSWKWDEPDLLGRYRLFYGGIDSAGIIKRADDLNSLMSTVPQRMAFETACPIVIREFSAAARDRLLLPMVDVSDLPEDPAGAAAIRENLSWLFQWLLGEVVSPGDAELERAFDLFSEIRRLRVAEAKSTYIRRDSGDCALDWNGGEYIDRDHDHTVRAWIAVLVYLMSDARFIYG